MICIFFSIYEDVLPENFLVIKTSIGGTRIIGRLCAGNKNALLLPHTTIDQELWHLRNSLSDRVEVHRIEERLSALGNCIACNDLFLSYMPILTRCKLGECRILLCEPGVKHKL